MVAKTANVAEGEEKSWLDHLAGDHSSPSQAAAVGGLARGRIAHVQIQLCHIP